MKIEGLVLGFSQVLMPPLFRNFVFLISGYIIFVIKMTKEFWEIIGLSLILGGALGNGLDRIINNYY